MIGSRTSAAVLGVLLTLAVLVVVGCGSSSGQDADRLSTIEAVEDAIRQGELGDDIAGAAASQKDLTLVELQDTGIPQKVYTFTLGDIGYGVMVDSGGLVLLGWGNRFRILEPSLEEKRSGQLLSYYYQGDFEEYWEATYFIGSMEVPQVEWGTEE